MKSSMDGNTSLSKFDEGNLHSLEVFLQILQVFLTNSY